jgi:hypothetical protein
MLSSLSRVAAFAVLHVRKTKRHVILVKKKLFGKTPFGIAANGKKKLIFAKN